MSIILPVSCGIHEFIDVSCVDSIGTLGLSYFTLMEGKECFEKPGVTSIADVLVKDMNNIKDIIT